MRVSDSSSDMLYLFLIEILTKSSLDAITEWCDWAPYIWENHHFQISCEKLPQTLLSERLHVIWRLSEIFLCTCSFVFFDFVSQRALRISYMRQEYQLLHDSFRFKRRGHCGGTVVLSPRGAFVGSSLLRPSDFDGFGDVKASRYMLPPSSRSPISSLSQVRGALRSKRGLKTSLRRFDLSILFRLFPFFKERPRWGYKLVSNAHFRSMRYLLVYDLSFDLFFSAIFFVKL